MNEYINLIADIEASYKKMMTEMYRRHSGIHGSALVSEMFAHWVANHQHEKIMSQIAKDEKRKTSKAKIKSEIETEKIKYSLEHYLDGL